MAIGTIRRSLFIGFSICLLSGLARSAWAEEPLKTQQVAFAGYEVNIPTRFEALPVPEGALPDFMKMSPYQALEDGEVAEALMFVRMSHPRMVEEANRDLERAVVNFLSGLMRKQQLQLDKPTVSKPVDWKGRKVTKYVFPAKMPTGSDALLAAFVFMEDEAFVCITHVNYTSDDPRHGQEIGKVVFAKGSPTKTVETP